MASGVAFMNRAPGVYENGKMPRGSALLRRVQRVQRRRSQRRSHAACPYSASIEEGKSGNRRAFCRRNARRATKSISRRSIKLILLRALRAMTAALAIAITLTLTL